MRRAWDTLIGLCLVLNIVAAGIAGDEREALAWGIACAYYLALLVNEYAERARRPVDVMRREVMRRKYEEAA